MDNILFKPKQASLDDKNRIVIILQLVSLDTVRVSLYFAWIAASSPWTCLTIYYPPLIFYGTADARLSGKEKICCTCL